MPNVFGNIIITFLHKMGQGWQLSASNGAITQVNGRINFLLTFISFYIKLQLLFRCSCSSIGNPVKVGDGPAAVVLPFPDGKGNPFSLVCHCSRPGMGRPLKGRESQKTCLNRWAWPSRTEGQPQDLEDKKGKSPDRFISVRGFFFGPPVTQKIF